MSDPKQIAAQELNDLIRFYSDKPLDRRPKVIVLTKATMAEVKRDPASFGAAVVNGKYERDGFNLVPAP